VKNPVKGLGQDLEFRVVGWRAPDGKLLDIFQEARLAVKGDQLSPG